MAEKARKDLRDRLELRAKQAEAKIANAEAKAIADVKSQAADMALAAAEKLMRENLGSADHTRLVKDGIAQIGTVIN